MRVIISTAISFLATWRLFGAAAAICAAATAGRDIARAWVSVAHRTPPDERRRRLDACDRCPIHFGPLNTCGIPGDVDEAGEKIGCWCPHETASFVAGKKCWRGEAHGDSQW